MVIRTAILFGLISAYSAWGSWAGLTKARDVVYSREEDGIYSETNCELTDIDVVILNLRSGLTYRVRLLNTNRLYTSLTLETSGHDDLRLNNLYASIRTDSGTFDMTRLDRGFHDVLLANFSNLFTSGDNILATVCINEAPRNYVTCTVTDGDSLAVNASQVYYLFFFQ